jgi:hypothetical protein
VPDGKKALHLNLDETSVSQFVAHLRGNVFVSKKRRGERGLEPIQRIARRRTRAALTHVAIICDDASIQPTLPQILLTNEHTITKRDASTIEQTLPPNIALWRQKSSWTNTEVMCRILGQLGTGLATHTHLQPILSLDCARQHLNPKIAKAAARYGIWIMYIPAGLTWLLQPCDTHLFSRYKRYLGARLQAEKSLHPQGDVNTLAWIRCITATIRKVMQGVSWRRAFASDGMSRHQSEVSSYIHEALSIKEFLPVPSSRPTDDQLAYIFPQNTNVQSRFLWRPFAPANEVAHEVALEDAAARPQPLPWALRSASQPPEDVAPAAQCPLRRRRRRLRIMGSTSAGTTGAQQTRRRHLQIVTSETTTAPAETAPTIPVHEGTPTAATSSQITQGISSRTRSRACEPAPVTSETSGKSCARTSRMRSGADPGSSRHPGD